MPIPQNSIDIFSNSISLYKGLLDSPSDRFLFNKALNLYTELVNDGLSQVFSHNDLHRSNLLWDDKYYFLDWEYASLNHPCFDIASLVRSFQLNQDQIDDLSMGYKYNSQIFDPNILNQWIKFIDNLDKIWEISVTKIQENLASSKT
jgi:thiamine kinase-like enzyme